MVIFRKRLKEKRIERGLTQKDLGENVFLSKGEICAYEKGKRIPPLDVLIRISNFLEVDFLWLLGLEFDCERGEDRLVQLSSDDIFIINALKKDADLYAMFLENPERTLSKINSAIHKN